ncbi:hypothetical protein KO498_05070 [Lentibacter algarum]|uniref:flagellin n=1 Tax=Lentibacter algarum TaxID=576131 RepID=UPI001C069B2D|nr:flagellin [Lentibacter algarum]MBU2981177.1 hypothetical protein [Lentibacter algarum]
MNSLSFGDMAQSTLLRRQNSQLKSEMSRLTLELSSGKVQDVSKHLGGDFGYLGEVERSLRVTSAFKTSASEAATFAASMQSALGFVSNAMGSMGVGLIAAGEGAISGTRDVLSNEASGQFEMMIGALNTTVAGRSVFAGIDTNGAALASAEDMLADLRTALAGQTTLAGVETVMDDWFNAPGGGFETVGYLGESQSLEPFMLGDGERVSLDVRADGAALRQSLKATAMAALATDSSLAFAADVQAGMLGNAGEAMLGANDQVTAIRAKLGFAEARIEDAGARLASEHTSLEYARGDLLGADPYETITRLEETQFRLESLYAATSRLSQLSLMGYMR